MLVKGSQGDGWRVWIWLCLWLRVLMVGDGFLGWVLDGLIEGRLRMWGWWLGMVCGSGFVWVGLV